MKKIICFALCLLLILPSAVSSYAYSGADAIKLLKSMGVISGDPDGNLRENDLVTRAEFAKMAVMLSEYRNEVSLNAQISVFEDCPYLHWASPYVKTASEHGIIEGYADGLFRPEQNISYTEAVTIALRLLGYGNADFGNAYPEPQRAMALSLKLNNGIAKSGDDALTRSELAVILANTLITDKNGGDDYAKALGYTIADDVIIIATNDENASVQPGKVYTSNGEYNISSMFDKGLLGRKGTAVIDSEGYLLTLLDNGISTSDYALYQLSADKMSLYGDEGIVSLSVDSGTLVYDGIQKSSFATVSSKLQTGDSLKIARTKDGGIDYILLTGSGFDGPYTASADGSMPKDGDYSAYSFMKNGKSCELSDIEAYDIIYISRSLKTVFIYNKKVGGVYSSASPDSFSPTAVTVGGVQYEIESPLAFSKLTAGDVSIGDSIVLLLGREGGIADIRTEKTDGNDAELSIAAIENTIPDNSAVLSALGAISDSSYDADSIITRAEFAKMAVMVSEFRKSLALDVKLSVFPDCPYTHWASPYIKTAAENAIMSAYSDSCFYPDNAVNLAEAVDCALKILGYSDSDFGEYPSSQLSLASSKFLIADISKGAYDSLSKGDAVSLLYNTLLASCNGSAMKLIQKLGYEYYEDAVIMATNNENSSVPSGKVLSSVGTYTAGNGFDSSYIGKSGSLLAYSGTLTMFNPAGGYISEGIVYSAVPGGIMLIEHGGFLTLSLADDISVYANAQKGTFSSSKSQISAGDSVYINYDSAKRLKYIYIDSSKTAGPFVVKSPSSWYVSVSGASNNSTLLKSGRKIDADELAVSDIIYYTPSLDTAFVYSEKRIGILENISPAKDSPKTITVSGMSYDLETASALMADAQYGDIMVLCLGRDNMLAHSYSLSDAELGACIVGSGVREFVNTQGDMYTSLYVKLAFADGTELDLPTDSNYETWIGNTARVSYADKKVKISVINGGFNISGKVNSAELKIGSHKLSADAKIIDVSLDNDNKSPVYKSVYPQRLDGIIIDKDDVMYARTESGYISELILKNVTGDAYKYGIITKASSNVEDFSASGSYTCDAGGSTYSYSGGAYTNIKKGSVVRVTMSGNKVDSFKKLEGKQIKISKVGYTDITASDGSVYKLSDELHIYRLVGASEYTLLPISELAENMSSYTACTVYSDKAESKGGRIRVIVVR